MKFVVRLFTKLTGLLPELLYLKRKTYYVNRHEQGRRIHGAALLVSNHTSLMDFVTLFFLFFGRTLHVLAAEVLYGSALMRFFLDCLGCIRVDRNTSDMSFLQTAIEQLRRGKVVGVFPESKLSTDGRMQDFKPSIAYIALKSGAPIIPIYCEGKYGLFKRARVVVGERIYLREYCSEAEPSAETLERLAALVRGRILELKTYLEACDSTKVDRRVSLHWFPYDFLRVTSWPAFQLCFRPHYYYAEGVPHKRRIKGGAIVITNHVTFLDPLVVAHTFSSRRVFFLAAEVLFTQNRMLKWFMELIGSIRINREVAMDIDSFNRTIAVLKAGGVVGVFPEGRISRGEGLLPFKSGTALMAALSGKPIIPMYKIAAPKLLQRTNIIIGRAIDPKQYLTNGQITVRQMEQLTEKLQQQMIALSAELARQLSKERLNDEYSAEVST